MPEFEPSVVVVDDDPAVCEALQWMLESEGYTVRTYLSAAAFLSDRRMDRPYCLLLDVRMPGMTGLELQSKLKELGDSAPIIVMSGHADVPMAVRAVKEGALDFFEKPVNDQLLLKRVAEALERAVDERQIRSEKSDTLSRLETLTTRECEVMNLIAAGSLNKDIAEELYISPRTVEVHRKHVFQKIGVHSSTELVRVLLEAGVTLPYKCNR